MGTEVAFLMQPVVLVVAGAIVLMVMTGLAARIAMFVEDLSYRQVATKRAPLSR